MFYTTPTPNLTLSYPTPPYIWFQKGIEKSSSNPVEEVCPTEHGDTRSIHLDPGELPDLIRHLFGCLQGYLAYKRAHPPKTLP